MGYSRTWWRVALGSLLVLIAPALAPVAHAQQPTIDVTRDRNGDGIPDELAAEVKRVELARDRQSAIAQLASRLPYSGRTRALQAVAERLQHDLEKTHDQTASEKIIGE